MLSPRDLLDEWHRDARPIERALGLLSHHHGTAPDALWDLPIGARDAALLALYAAAFGDRIEAEAPCERCGERLAIPLTPSALIAAHRPVTGEAAALEEAGHTVRFRLPTSRDQAAAGDAASVDEAEARLLERCVLSASRDGAAVAPADLPAEVRAALGAAMEQLDPLAEIRLAVQCPCGHRSVLALDVVEHVCSALDERGRALIGEVHQLASAYHWSEADILAMPAERRRQYLRLVER
jgi:hypothetical protein